MAQGPTERGANRFWKIQMKSLDYATIIILEEFMNTLNQFHNSGTDGFGNPAYYHNIGMKLYLHSFIAHIAHMSPIKIFSKKYSAQPLPVNNQMLHLSRISDHDMTVNHHGSSLNQLRSHARD